MNKKGRVLFWGRVLSPVLVMAVIFLFSMENSGESSGRSVPISNFLGVPDWVVRKGAHVLLFGLLGLAWFSVLRAQQKISLTIQIIISTLLVLLYAVFDEIHQTSVSGRAGLVTDVLLDTAGGALFIMARYLSEGKK